MRASNSRRSLNAPSSSIVVTFSVVLLTILLVAPIQVNTRSVTDERRDDVRELTDSTGDWKNQYESPEDDRQQYSYGEDKVPSSQRKSRHLHFGNGSQGAPGIGKEVDDGIRRFDAVVANDGTLGKTSASKTEISKNRQNSNAGEIGKTVSRGIFVRDDLIEAETGVEHFKENRKRSVNVSKSFGLGVGLGKNDAEKSIHDKFPGRGQVDIPSHNVREESSSHSIKSRQVPVLIPVGSSHAKPHHKLAEHSEKPIVAESRKSDDHSPAIEGSADRVTIEKGKSEIPELTKTHDKSASKNDKSEIVIPEEKKIGINSDGLRDAAETSAESPIQADNARKSLPIVDEHDESDADDDQSQSKIEIGKKIEEKKLKPVKNEDSIDYDSSSLTNIMKTNVSLEGLKLQAMSLQKDIKNKTLLQSLKDQSIQVLPGIPKFSENELLEALHEIDPPKKTLEGEYSYLSKLDTSTLSERQLKILKCAEALVVREQRQTFGENVIECIRGLNILNCMRIFVWPIIADNLPQTLSQNLPTLPIEVNVMDWLPGNQQDKPKSTRLRSATSSHQQQQQQQQLVTPELVVSAILRDALNANPINDDIPTFIDPQNETLSKLLTPGQLEILKMAEKFLPESARKEYSEYMYSCVRTFEYFSCVKYFAWPMVQRYLTTLPDFPNYPSWYPSVSDLPAIGSPVLSIVNSEGIGELPEIIEADDPKRTRSPRPEAVIVNILENTLRQSPNQPIYQARHPETIPTVTADQMAIFYLAEQLIPIPMRAEFMSKTMQCIRDYDYLSCTKYATWPTVRQFIPNLPSFPDFTAWIPTFAVPNFSQYIPDIASYFPGFPGFPGSQTEKPAPAAEAEQVNATAIVTNSTMLLKEENRQAEALQSMENRIIDILYNIRWTVLTRQTQPAASAVPGNFAILNTLSYNQRQILGLATSIVPPQLRTDLDARFIGCLQGGSDFLTCTRNIIWPTLQLYVKDLPVFPERETEPVQQIGSESVDNSKLEGFGALKPGIYQPQVDSRGPVGLRKIGTQFAGRSPIGSQIAAEPEEAPIFVSQIQPEVQPSENLRKSEESIGSIGKKTSAKSSDASAPVISVTDTRFTPIFSDNPESVLLKILTTVQSSSKFADTSYTLVTSEYLESLKDYLNTDQKSIIQVSERLLPESAKLKFTESMSGCVKTWNFSICSREIVWPTLSQYYPQLPSFPTFNIDETRADLASPASTKSIVTADGAAAAAISETDVKTGQHGDAVVTITDTRFVPIYSQHPEEVILGILKNVQSSSPNFLIQQNSGKPVTRPSEFVASFTDQQGNIITISENLLPEQIREVFTKKMTECVKENSFLACTRDIAWPTIAQFFPRLPNFPNIGALPEVPQAIPEEPQQPTLLPPQLDSGTRHAVLAKSPIIAEAPSLALLTQNYLPFVPEDVESRIESILKQISSSGLYPQSKTSYLNTKDPLTAPFLTERQSNVIRMTENMLPSAMKPLFVGLMIDCSRENVFPICVRNVGWPMLRQFVPNVPSFPDLNNFGTYFPQVPQEIPQIPQFPQGQLPQVPNFPGFGFPGSGYGYGFRAAQDKIDHNVPPYVPENSFIAGGQQTGNVYLQGIQGIPGITPSVDTQRTRYDRSSPSRSFVVSRHASKPADLLSGAAVGSIGNNEQRRRERRSLPTVPTENRQNEEESFDNADLTKLNVTESEFLQILINITKQSDEETRGPDFYFVDKLNSTIKEVLTDDQFAILKIVEDLSHRTAKAGFMSKVIQCITSLSFIRCMGIFVWPLITQNLPSLLGNLNPFGRSHEDNSSFVDIFGMTEKEFERELLLRKENAEGILIDWYRGIVEDRFDNDYGYVRIQGYGDGEIGISFNNGFSRTGRISKIKDHKNLPSILTIISDIMEDMLDQRESKPDNDRKKDHKKRDNGKRDRSMRRGFIGDYNKLVNESDNFTDSTERSSNDDEIISMFLDKIKSNGSNDNDANSEAHHHFLNVENAYEAFELLFGTRLSQRMAERLNDLGKNHFRLFDDQNSEEFPAKNVENKTTTGKKRIHSGLVLRLPKIDEELMSRKITGSLENLGRKMKMQMSQILPGITFVFSFFIQMALAHARAAASIAGMMSNMALGSAMLDMLRQNLFGPSTEPKIKYIYDNEMVGPGITWPQHNHHG